MSQQIDDLDREIIEHLTVDGRASASEIAQRIGKVSERTIRNRISALLQSRQIVIGAIPDPIIAEPGVQADVLIDVEPGMIDQVAAALAEFDQVGYLAATTGDYSLNASIFAETNAELLDFAKGTSRSPKVCGGSTSAWSCGCTRCSTRAPLRSAVTPADIGRPIDPGNSDRRGRRRHEHRRSRAGRTDGTGDDQTIDHGRCNRRGRGLGPRGHG